jgi:superfamily II DNA or RNA helicase
MTVITVDNVYARIIDLDIDRELLENLRDLLSYEVEDYYFGQKIVNRLCLFNSAQMVFPTGLISIVRNFFDKYRILYEIHDERDVSEHEEPLSIHEIELRDYQKKVVKKSIRNQRGIIKVATGGGKTVIGAAIAASLSCNTIFCVHTKDLLQQTWETFSKILQIDIGRVGAGFMEVQKITVCMIQTLNSVLGHKYIPADEYDRYREIPGMENRKLIAGMLSGIQCVIIDEAQHISAQSYVNLMQALPKARYRFGMSGTPWRNDGRDLVLQAYAGREIVNINASWLIKHGYLSRPTIYIISTWKKYKSLDISYQKAYKEYIVECDRRNRLICQYAEYFHQTGRKLLITVNQIKHGKILLEQMKSMFDARIEFLTSEIDLKKRTVLLNEMRYRDLSIIMGTSLCDEGLDIPIVDALILAGAGKSNIRILQRIGRTLRLHPDKKNPVIIDFNDRIRFFMGQARKRFEIYKTEPEFRIRFRN